MPESLEATIRQLVGNKLSETEIQQLLAAIATGQATLATGERAISLGGSASDVVIVTGDRNILIQIDAGSALPLETLKAILSESSNPEQTTDKMSIEELVQQVRRDH